MEYAAGYHHLLPHQAGGGVTLPLLAHGAVTTVATDQIMRKHFIDAGTATTSTQGCIVVYLDLLGNPFPIFA